MPLARNTEGYNLLKALVESYGANKVRETVALIVGLDVSDPEDARHASPGLVSITIDERSVRRPCHHAFGFCPNWHTASCERAKECIAVKP